jgi:hypothetical protein
MDGVSLWHDGWRYGLVKADHYRPIEEQNLIQPLLTIPLVSVSFLSVSGAKLNKMTQELLDKIYNETLNKPNSFHYVCYGGGTVKMVDKHTNEKTFTCKYQGDKNWITPACEKCTGLTME